jgi:hypothetical protein
MKARNEIIRNIYLKQRKRKKKRKKGKKNSNRPCVRTHSLCSGSDLPICLCKKSKIRRLLIFDAVTGGSFFIFQFSQYPTRCGVSA